MKRSASQSRPAAVAATLALVLAACEATPTPTPRPTDVPEPTPVTTTYTLDTTVWYAGLVMTFATATAELGSRGGTVKVGLKLENPGQDDLSLDEPIRLTTGQLSIEPTRETVLPSVGAGSSAFTTLTFEVIGRSSVDDGVLLVGAPDRHQAVVPLVPGAVKPVLLEPIDFSMKGAARADLMRLTILHGTLRWDLPDWGDELPGSSASLTLTYDVTYTGTFSGGVPFTGDNIALQLPDGTVIKARADGRSQSVGVVGPGKTLHRLSTRFEIPAAIGATYTLILGFNGKQGRIRFSLPR